MSLQERSNDRNKTGRGTIGRIIPEIPERESLYTGRASTNSIRSNEPLSNESCVSSEGLDWNVYPVGLRIQRSAFSHY